MPTSPNHEGQGLESRLRAKDNFMRLEGSILVVRREGYRNFVSHTSELVYMNIFLSAGQKGPKNVRGSHHPLVRFLSIAYIYIYI